MDLYGVLDQIVELLRSRKRVTYRLLQRQFNLDETTFAELRDELLFAYPQVHDEAGRGLMWTDIPEMSGLTSPQDVPPLSVPPSPRPDAERRQLTVMFSDVVDSTKLSGQLDPEEYRDVLRAYQHTCAAVVQRFNGYIAQHLGDALLVYFGFPTADEFDAQRGVLAGLGMLDAMHIINARLQREQGLQLSIRVGIHTGLTVVGDVGADQKHELLALGEAPNVAARIQSLAQPDTMAISEATYRLVQGYFVCDELGSHMLKGVSEPQRVYRVRGASGVRHRLDIATSRGLTPLVGREQEIGLLLERWKQAQAGQGQVVLLSGEGGIGKSRLVQAMQDHAASIAHTRLECRSSPYYQHSALYPLADLLQRALRLQADDSPGQRLEKLAGELSQYRLPLAETVPLFAGLLSLAVPEEQYPPLNVSPQRLRQKTLEAIVAILLELAERQPVLFIIEDLHWLDPTSLELLDLLMAQTPTARLLTLLTCRPEFQPSWSTRSYLTQVTVHRLFREQIERMATHMAGGKPLPVAVLQQIVDKTDGVPLFVEEMTKAVLESGLLQEINGRYEISGTVSSLAIPATLQDSLMARLDRLVSAKGVAQLAAVIGREFPYELLQAVSPLDAVTLQRELGRLVEAELVYQRGLPPQAFYMFKHALVQDAAYQSLLRRTRRDSHQRIAEVLVRQFPETAETRPELLAHHYTEAGQHEHAIPYWQRAGQRAVERSANIEAVGHLTRGLALIHTLPDTPERAEQELLLLNTMAAPVMATKGYAAPETGNIYNRARQLCEVSGARRHLFPALAGIAQYELCTGALRTADRLVADFLRLAQQQDDVGPLLEAHRLVGIMAIHLGQFSRARRHFEQVLALFDPQQHQALALQYGQNHRMSSCVLLSWALLYLGYPHQALYWRQEAVAAAEATSHLYTKAYATTTTLHILRYCRDVQTMQESAAGSVAFCREQGFAAWLSKATIFQGWALVAQDQIEEGMALIHNGIDTWQAGQPRLWLPRFLMTLAEAYGLAGQPIEGLRVLADGMAIMDQTHEAFFQAEMYRLKGELLVEASHGNVPEAIVCFRQAIEVAQTQEAKFWELRAATSLARLWQTQGERRAAYDLLAPVYHWFTEGFDTASVQEAKALLDDLA